MVDKICGQAYMIFILTAEGEFFKNVMPCYLLNSYCDGQAVPLDLEAHDTMIVQYTAVFQ